LHPLAAASTANAWLINADSLVAAGYSDSALTQYARCIRIHLFLHQGCDFINGVTDDSVSIFAHNHCNDVFSKAQQSTTFIWDSTSNCTNCFTLTKTVDKPTAYVGDTITYNIIVCANNGSP
jgi:hypothetical protein